MVCIEKPRARPAGHPLLLSTLERKTSRTRKRHARWARLVWNAPRGSDGMEWRGNRPALKLVLKLADGSCGVPPAAPALSGSHLHLGGWSLALGGRPRLDRAPGLAGVRGPLVRFESPGPRGISSSFAAFSRPDGKHGEGQTRGRSSDDASEVLPTSGGLPGLCLLSFCSRSPAPEALLQPSCQQRTSGFKPPTLLPRFLRVTHPPTSVSPQLSTLTPFLPT
jgi:hypothetical protein